MQHLPDLYVSHLIYQMMLDNHTFTTQHVQEYVDWGTLSEWTLYKQEYATLFIDIDGVLVENSGQYFSPKWGETKSIKPNVEIINNLFDSGKVQVILTTARKSSFKDETEKQLEKAGIKYHKIIYDLLHCKRILINDYSKTNPYKSCDAINLKRNSPELSEMLKDCIKNHRKQVGKC
jgi:histidinol phosphatase-like enzyme